MKRAKLDTILLDTILHRTVIPWTAYVTIGLFVFELSHIEMSKQFLIWSVISGIIFAIKDIVQRKIVTAGIWVYIGVVIGTLVFQKENRESYQMMFMLAGILAMVLLRALKRYLISYIIMGYGGVLFLVILTMKGYECSKLLIALNIFLFFYAVSQTLAMGGKTNQENTSLLLVYMLIALITLGTPVSEEPYGWDFVENIANAMKETIKNITLEIDYLWGMSKNHDIFRVSFLGYEDGEDSIKDGVLNNQTPQLGLEGRRTHRNLYLKGNMTNYFTGETWKDNLGHGTIDSTTDTLMSMYAIYFYYWKQRSEGQVLNHLQNIEEIQRFVQSYHYDITFKNLRTRSIFYPVKTLKFSGNNIKTKGDNIQSNTTNERGYRYNIEFLDIDYSNSVLSHVMQNSSGIVYDEAVYYEMYDNMQKYFGVELEKIPFEHFKEEVRKGKESIVTSYAAVDGVVSASVYELVDTIVKGCANDYQKCKAMEKFLTQYRYNKGISIPKDKNVLDWFLFVGLEGYCTHFSTALVEMLRIAGIPSRMVEGFLVDYAVCDSLDSYVVTAQNTHAWTEAYIDGFGWIRLDATTSDYNENSAWYPEDDGLDTPNETSPAWNENWQERLEELRKEEELRLEEELIQKEEEKENLILAVLLLFGMIVMIVITVGVLWIYQKVGIRKSKNPNVIFQDIMQRLQKQYGEKLEGETLKEYFGKIKEVYGVFNNMDNVVQIMERYWYADFEITEYEIEILKDFRDELKYVFQEKNEEKTRQKNRNGIGK